MSVQIALNITFHVWVAFDRVRRHLLWTPGASAVEEDTRLLEGRGRHHFSFLLLLQVLGQRLSPLCSAFFIVSRVMYLLILFSLFFFSPRDSLAAYSVLLSV